MQVTFFIPDEPDLPDLLTIDPDVDWQRMRRRQRWLLQTYLRLDRAGCPVAASDRVPDQGIVVFHSKHKRKLLRQLNGRSRPILVGIRGDLSEPLIADYEVLQNGHWADGHRRFFIPYWPQPGLIARDSSRESRVEGLSFKGFDHNPSPPSPSQVAVPGSAFTCTALNGTRKVDPNIKPAKMSFLTVARISSSWFCNASDHGEIKVPAAVGFVNDSQ